MAGADVLDYTKTQRIVLLIDLTPLLHLQNPNLYIKSIINSSRSLLSFSPLANSLSSFKLFFSSLSPLLSSSTLVKILPNYSPNSLSFALSNETLISISETLISISSRVSGSGNFESGSRAKCVASSMAEIVHDYAWEMQFQDPLGMDNETLDLDFSGVVRSNLVVLFSPVCRSLMDLCDYMDVDRVRDDFLSVSHLISDRITGVFGHVNDAFCSRDVHCTWVDVNCNLEFESEKIEFDENGNCLRLFESGIKSLGWGFCSSDAIVLGSALVPFGLIYPMIGASLSFHDCNDFHASISGQLNLEILDVSGKPLLCKCCDLELLNLKTSIGSRPSTTLYNWEYLKLGSEYCEQVKGFWGHFSDGCTNINVKAIWRSNKLTKIKGHVSDILSVHGFSGESKKNNEGIMDDFFAHRVLEILSTETMNSTKKKAAPIWQLFLSFLYRKDYCALVLISNDKGSSFFGVLKPFSVHLALLFVLKSDVYSPIGGCDLNKLNVSELAKEMRNEMGGLDIDTNSQNGIGRDESKRKNKKHFQRYKNLSWSDFCKKAFEDFKLELEEAFFFKGYENSKKLKFFKCWMKQIDRNRHCDPCKPKVSLPNPETQVLKNTEERLRGLDKEAEQPLHRLDGENLPYEPCQMKELTQNTSCIESSEAFFTNLSERIQHGIESGVNLAALAHRIVNSSIYWLSRKQGLDTDRGSRASVEESGGSNCEGKVSRRLIKILLKDPKDLAGRQKDSDQLSQGCDGETKFSSAYRVREYELQILFRMEILQSEAATGISESTKQRFIKQICSLLEIAQCSMEEGFFGDFNLTDYVGNLIETRYSENLGDVVHIIYEQMDLLLFEDEDESPNPLLNSEESNQSWRVGDNSVEDSSPGSPTNSRTQKDIDKDEHARKLLEAQERRERACRFSSFTRRGMPDLQRVWAPKQQKMSWSKQGNIQKGSKRKAQRRESYDKVCETPMSGSNKTSREEREEHRRGSSGSVFKALFQDG